MSIKTKLLVTNTYLIVWGGLSTLILLLLTSTPGITGEIRKEPVKNKEQRATPTAAKSEENSVELVIKYLTGGEIIVTNPKGEIIVRSKNDLIAKGPLSELRNISFATVTETVPDANTKNSKASLMDKIISPAMAATITYEYHYIKVDNQIVACRKHQVTPPPHKYVGNC
ncbi:MAG: hypothetical protein HOP23_07180 [Methylococcaceae bacterium]|nr:hypothetical protein [Methylococcaceae bacterium]